MVEKYIPNAVDKEFDNYWERVDCYAVVGVPYNRRCDFVRKAITCTYGANFVPYMELLACLFKCRNQFEELVSVTLFLFFCFELLLCLGYVVHYYYAPALKVVSRMMHMNEHLAGVTIVAFGNTLPDLFSSMAAVKDNGPVLANTICMSLFVTMFVGGLICYVSPFAMSGYTTVRDLLFFILGVMLLEYFMSDKKPLSVVECSLMIVVYLFYLIVNVLDVYLMKLALKSLRREITKLDAEERSQDVHARLQALEKKYIHLSADERVCILQRPATSVYDPAFTFITTRRSSRNTININRSPGFHALGISKNHHLFKDFMIAVRPFTLEDWRHANSFIRAYYIVRAPVAVFAAIYIPLLDYELAKNGWSKLLNCVQIFLNPAITIVMMKSLIFRKRSILWYKNLPHDIIYSLYSMIVTVPMAIFIFIDTNCNEPPSYHWMFTIMNLSGSMFLAFQCTYEISLIINSIGHLMKVKTDFMGATVSAFANALSDLVINISMAMQGYERMAYAATIGGAFLSILFASSAIIIMKIFTCNSSKAELFGRYGQNAFIMLIMGLLSTLLWTSLLDFKARRSVGIFSMSVYGLFLIFVTLINSNTIRSFEKESELQNIVFESGKSCQN